MHLAHLRLRDFRNYARLDVSFSPGFHLLLGNNAQGKTNILEAIYLLSTLRSFRGVGGAQMIRHQQKAYYLAATVVGTASHEIKIYWSPNERKLSLDGTTIRRLTEYFGIIRAVVFCTEDLQLIKGSGRIRRRFVDLLLAQTHRPYLTLLQRYSQALRARNALLKQKVHDESALDSFSHELIETGNHLMGYRKELIPRLAPLAQSAYQQIAGPEEQLKIEYQPSITGDFAVELAQSRKRELTYRATLLGPHRDELLIQLDGQAAAKFASEGQKRSIAIALKMAQAEFLTNALGSPPILLIDDVMGELDTRRRHGFLPLLHRVQAGRSQVFMTATEATWARELEEEVQIWEVDHGMLKPTSASKS